MTNDDLASAISYYEQHRTSAGTHSFINSATIAATLLFLRELQERRVEVEKYKAWAASCDEPPAELATKLRELAEAQTDLDPKARHVLYSRMRELYLKVEPAVISLDAASADPLACLHPVVLGDDGTGKKWCYTCGKTL